MGWRAGDAYEREAQERRRALPWHQRFRWRGLAAFALIVAMAGVYLWATLSH